MKIIIIALAVVFIIFPRWIYHTADVHYYFFPDSFSYIDRAIEIAGGKNFIHPRRLPLYPFIINSLVPIKKDTIINFQTVNQGIKINFRPLEDLQMYFGFFGGLFFALLSLKIFGKNWKFLLIMIIYGMNLYIFGWEKNILTESFTMNFLIIYLYVIYKFIRSGNLFFLIISTVITNLVFLLKPAYLFLCLSCLPFLLYYFFKNNNNNKIFPVIIISLFSLAIPLYYRFENKRLYNYDGISIVLDYNLMGKIIQYGLDTSEINVDKDYDEVLKVCAASKKDKAEMRKINNCIHLLNLKNDPYNIKANTLIGVFARKVILKHPADYLIKSFLLLPTVFTDIEEGWIVINQKFHLLNIFWIILEDFYKLLRYIMLLFLLFYPLSIFQFFKKTDKTTTIIVLTGTIVFYGIIFNTFFAHVEYDRLKSVVDPLLLLFCLYYLFNLPFLKKYVDKITKI